MIQRTRRRVKRWLDQNPDGSDAPSVRLRRPVRAQVVDDEGRLLRQLHALRLAQRAVAEPPVTKFLLFFNTAYRPQRSVCRQVARWWGVFAGRWVFALHRLHADPPPSCLSEEHRFYFWRRLGCWCVLFLLFFCCFVFLRFKTWRAYFALCIQAVSVPHSEGRRQTSLFGFYKLQFCLTNKDY